MMTIIPGRKLLLYAKEDNSLVSGCVSIRPATGQICLPELLLFDTGKSEVTQVKSYHPATIQQLQTSVLPIRHKHIRISRSAVVTITAEQDLFSIRTHHGEGIKTFVVTDLLHSASISIQKVHIERKPSFVF